MEKPTRLHHYTSIEGLAHILKSRQIRFSRLDFLDDKTEGQSKDPVDWRKFFFVSCWTAENEESIPLWHLYTPEMRGVRITLPFDFFQKYEFSPSDVPSFIQLADTSSAPPNANIRLRSYLPYEKMHGEDYFVMPPSFQKSWWPFPVEYTSDDSKLNQNLISRDESSGYTKISAFEVGRYKKESWSFQKEWRFRLYCHPAAPRSLKDSMPEQEYYELMLRELSDLRRGVSLERFFMEIDSTAFADMEILLGPKVLPAHKIIVKALTDAYCPTAKVTSSNLTGSIR